MLVGFTYGMRKPTRKGEEQDPNSEPIKAYLGAIMEIRSQPPEKRGVGCKASNKCILHHRFSYVS